MRFHAGGHEVRVESTPVLPLADILQVVQTSGLTSALLLQGALLLHGCVVEVSGSAIVVVGDSGAGKSTTAAGLLASGAALLSDDVACLEPVDGRVVAHAGPRGLRLTPEAARAAGHDPETLPRVFSSPLLPGKRLVRTSAADGTFCPDARPLAAVFALGRRTDEAEPRIERLGAAAALAALRAHGYRDSSLDRAQHARRLPLLARVAHEVPVYAAAAPDDLAALPRFVAALAAEVPC
jgi:hypothetical protein